MLIPCDKFLNAEAGLSPSISLNVACRNNFKIDVTGLCPNLYPIIDFKKLSTPDKYTKVIKLSELFAEWQDYVSKSINTEDIEINYDDGISYESANVTLEIEREDKKSWGSTHYATINFECEKDENMNFQVRISRWEDRKGELWKIDFNKISDIQSLRRLNQFEILLMRLVQNYVELEIDTKDFEEDEVEVEAEPEASFS